MAELTDWKKAITLPVIANGGKWCFAGLEKILTSAIALCATECLKTNKGVICTTLSGGLDSSLCLAKIREIIGREVKIHTFTTGGSEKYPDIQWARIISRRFNTVHHELIPSEEEVERAGKNLHSLWQDESCGSGNVAVFLTYQNIARHGFKCVIAHDGIDELLGGYWEHRKYDKDEKKKAEVFRDFWNRLEKEHLLLLERKAQYFGIQVILPYLQKAVVEYITKIPLHNRTTLKESKIPLRTIAKKFLPKEIIRRNKKGFCSALDKE